MLNVLLFFLNKGLFQVTYCDKHITFVYPYRTH